MAAQPIANLMDDSPADEDLIRLIRNHSFPLDPIDPGWTPRLAKFPKIRAVTFDIYGTMMVSSAGDISLAGGEHKPVEAMSEALATVAANGDSATALDRYHELLRSFQEKRRQEGIEHPEVEIREVWQQLLLEFGGPPNLASVACLLYECRVNPVWPMPGLASCLDSLRSAGKILGIVSNAQFYTPMLFPALVGSDLESLGFDPTALIFSFTHREAKPSRSLYRCLCANLYRSHGIRPSEILYIGNDRLKDIRPAREEGIKTVFFAGDQKSCRWRDEDLSLLGVEPDAVMTHLGQLPGLLD